MGPGVKAPHQSKNRTVRSQRQNIEATAESDMGPATTCQANFENHHCFWRFCCNNIMDIHTHICIRCIHIYSMYYKDQEKILSRTPREQVAYEDWSKGPCQQEPKLLPYPPLLVGRCFEPSGAPNTGTHTLLLMMEILNVLQDLIDQNPMNYGSIVYLGMKHASIVYLG